MKSMSPWTAAAVLLLGGGCADGRAVLDPVPSGSLGGHTALLPASAGPVAVSGSYDALVDFSTLTLTPRGKNCLLEVAGQLVFSGTIEGVAAGRTTALVFAPCAEVATTPPGTYRDVFRSELRFSGTVNGEPAEARVLYQGGVQVGGQIDGRIILSNGVAGVLEADATVAVGGSYQGSVVVR